MTKRIYRDPPQSERCEHGAFVGRHGETAQCGRRKKIGQFCRQHAKMADERAKSASQERA